ncbi:MAG: hypothetical protein WA802_09810 [Terracidiphilus sp.]
MKPSLLSKALIQGVLPSALMVVLAFPTEIFAQAIEQDHIVSPQEMQQRLDSSYAARQREIGTLTALVSSPAAERAIKAAHINPEQVRTAIPTLSDEELANLSTRAADAQQKFSAGSMTNDELLIVILIVAIVVIVVALH